MIYRGPPITLANIAQKVAPTARVIGGDGGRSGPFAFLENRFAGVLAGSFQVDEDGAIEEAFHLRSRKYGFDGGSSIGSLDSECQRPARGSSGKAR